MPLGLRELYVIVRGTKKSGYLDGATGHVSGNANPR